jgi:hypothetical protein
MFDRVADLEFEVTQVTARRQERETPRFTRVSTEIRLHGPDATGRGEDVTYDAPDHDDVPTATLDLAGTYTLAGFSAALDDVDLFAGEPERPASRHYRRWAFESAALDLALRSAERRFGDVLDREYAPVRFVVSPSLGEEPSIDPVDHLRARQPAVEFKLDPTPAWDRDLIDALAATDAVRVLDLKGYYEGTEVDNPADPDLYERVLSAFPDAVVEDPAFTDGTGELLEAAAHRLSFDYPVTDVAAVEALPVAPDWLNVKPSRFGTVESLLETIEYCEREGITMYGGGQFELGVGRGQIQALASLCYPTGPNDVAPAGYNDPEPSADLPASPLDVDPGPGFGTH